MFCKGFQQLKLTDTEIYFLFSPRNTAGLQVDLKVADLQNNIFLLWHLSAKDGLDACRQLLQIKWLYEIIVSA